MKLLSLPTVEIEPIRIKISAFGPDEFPNVQHYVGRKIYGNIIIDFEEEPFEINQKIDKLELEYLDHKFNFYGVIPFKTAVSEFSTYFKAKDLTKVECWIDYFEVV